MSERGQGESPTGRAKGGVARARSLTPEQLSEAAKNAAVARWSGNVPIALREGALKIGNIEIECAVLPDGTRVLSERAITGAFGGKRGGAHWRRKKAGDEGANLPVFLSAKNISSNLPSDLTKALSQPILYRPATGGRTGHGIEATRLPKICNALLTLRDQKKLLPSQEAIAAQADILIRGLADVGIIALVDEATGYQDIRPRDELRLILEKYIAKELLPWTRRFPPEFYEELFRLRKWQYNPVSVKRPRLVGYLTENIVYKRLPPGILEELKRLNPKDERGRRKRKHFQFLTANIGNPHLEKHIGTTVTLMRIASSWTQFKKFLDKAFPIPKPQPDIPGLEAQIDDEEDSE